jgi:hypothetical protein
MKTGGRATKLPMRLAGLLVLAVSAPASAAPCAVTVVRAPDGVREVVDHWIAAEPHCASALEVRIVETAEGLYVVAQDRDGRIRDRVVPDARTAGVLIASWAADDSVPFAHAPAPIIAPELGEEAPTDRLAESQALASEHHWIRFGMIRGLGGAMLSLGNDTGERSLSTGVRGTVGVWSRGAWTIDASLDFVDDLPLAVGYGGGAIGIREYNAFANLGYVLRSGRWSVTPALGLGVRHSRFDYLPDPSDFTTMYPFGLHREGFFAVAQGSAIGAVDFADRFQLTVQLSSMLHPDSWQLRENLELVWIGGVGVVL